MPGGTRRRKSSGWRSGCGCGWLDWRNLQNGIHRRAISRSYTEILKENRGWSRLDQCASLGGPAGTPVLRISSTMTVATAKQPMAVNASEKVSVWASCIVVAYSVCKAMA